MKSTFYGIKYFLSHRILDFVFVVRFEKKRGKRENLKDCNDLFKPLQILIGEKDEEFALKFRFIMVSFNIKAYEITAMQGLQKKKEKKKRKFNDRVVIKSFTYLLTFRLAV